MGWLAPTRNPPRGGPHLVLAGAGRGRLWDCSRARCWLASAGTVAQHGQDPWPCALPSRSLDGQRLGLLRGTKLAPGGSPGDGPSPLHACSWLVSTFRISLTQAALISGVGACAPEQTRGECVPTVTRASVSLCRGSGHVGTGGDSAALGVQEGPPSGEGVLTAGA